MNALCAIDNGLLSANGLLTPEPPTNLAVNYTISVPLDSDPDLVLHYPFNQNILDYPGTIPTTGISDAIIVGDSSKIYLSSNYSIFSNGTSLYSNSNSVNDYLSIDSGDTSIANTKGYTFSYWIYLTKTPTSNDDIIYSMRQNNSNYYYKMNINSTNQLVIYYRNSGDIITNITISSKIVLYAWNHIVWTLSTGGISNVYINGSQVVVNSTSLAYFSPMINNKKIFGDGVNTPINGYMNDFRYYNRILDSAEVFQLYNIYSLRFNSGFQWQSFYGDQNSSAANTINLPTTGKLNSFQYNAYYSGGNNNSLSSNSSNLLTTINYTNNIAAVNNIFGFSSLYTNVGVIYYDRGEGVNIGLLVYGYFRPNISGVWNLKLDTDNFGALWFNDGSGGSSFWPPTDTNYRITGNVTAPSYNTASLIVGTYYPFQITWSQLIGDSKLIFSFKHTSSGTFMTNGTGYFFSQKPTTPIYTDLSLVLYYPFDQNIYNYATGYPVLDSSFNTTNTIIAINNTFYKVGNGSLNKSSNANDQYLLLNTIPNNSGGYSFAFWFRFTNLTNGTIFSFGNNNKRIKMSYSSANGITLSIDSTSPQSINTTYTPSSNTWHHYVWTLETLYSNSNFYVDGTLYNGFPSAAITYASFSMIYPYNYIFADNNTGGTSAQGYLDDFRYYNSILTPTTIASLSNNQVSNYPVFPKSLNTGLVLYYPFNGNILNYASGTGVSDASFVVPGSIGLVTDNYIVGTGSVYKAVFYNNTSYFLAGDLSANTGGYSFSLWVNFVDPSYGIIFSFANSLSSNRKRIYFYNTGNGNLRISCDDDDNNISNTFPSLNTWNHYVWTLDTGNNNCFYINGELFSGFPNVSVDYASFAMNNNYIFADTYDDYPDISGVGMQGYVDDFRYYNRILTQSEVTQLFNMYIPSKVSSDNLILYYPFNTDILNYASGTGVTNGVIINDNTSYWASIPGDNNVAGPMVIVGDYIYILKQYDNGGVISKISLSNPQTDSNYNWFILNNHIATGIVVDNTNTYLYVNYDNNNNGNTYIYKISISDPNTSINYSYNFSSRLLATDDNYLYTTLIDKIIRILITSPTTVSDFFTSDNPTESFVIKSGYMYISELYSNSITKISISDPITIITNWATGFVGNPLGLCIDSTNTNIFATSLANTNIYQIPLSNPSNKTIFLKSSTGIINNSSNLLTNFNNTYMYASNNLSTISRIKLPLTINPFSTVSLNTTTYIIGTGSLYQSASNNIYYFSVNALAANKNGYTFSLWFYFTPTTDTSGTIFSFAENLNSSTRITFANTGSNLSISFNGTSISNLPGLAIDSWRHFVWTLDTNSNSNFYVNGTLQSGFPTQTIPYASFLMNYNYILGDTSGGNGQQGYVDDFRYYDSILNQLQVSALYNMRGTTFTQPLILHYPFDGNLTNYGTFSTMTNTIVGSSASVSLNSVNYIVGTGSLYKTGLNTTSYFRGISNTVTTNSNGFSFSFWLYLTFDVSGMIFSFDNSANVKAQRTYLYYNAGTSLRISNSGEYLDLPGTSPQLKTWNHYVWLLSPIQSVNNFYINGVREARTTYPPYNNNSNYTNKKKIVIFGDSVTNAPDNGAQGYIDDFRYYDGNLNQRQISALYNLKGPINTPELILYYPFNTDISNYASGTGVTFGTIVGSTVSLSNTNYAVGTGSLYQSASNTTSYFSIPTIPTNIVGFSFSLWVYFTSMNDGMIFSFAAGTTTSNIRIFISLISSTICIGFGTTANTNTLISASLNTWYHYVWTLDTTNKNNFYVNGVLLYNSSTTPGYLPGISLTTNRILGNTTTTAPANGSQGYVDDFRYYDGILSSMQVNDLYNLKNPQNFNPNTDSALCIYYPFDISRNYVVNYAASVYGTVDASYVSGAVVDYTTNKVGKGALKLVSTSSQYVILNSNNIVQTTNFISSNGMTFSLWIKSNSTSSNAAIFYFGYNDTDYIGLFFDNTGSSILCKVYNTQLISVGLSINYNNNIWRHVVWTLGYSSSNTSRWNIYIDGSMVSVTSNNYYPISTTAKTTSRLGRDGGSIFYNGWIDDFRVYQRVLNQLEVTQLYNYQDTSANFPTLNVNTPNFTWTPPARNGGVSYNYYYTDNTLNTSSSITNTKATNVLIPEINIDNSNSYYVNSQRSNKQSVYANITI